MVTAPHQTGSDGAAPADRTPALDRPGANVKQAHLTVCSARCAQRDARACVSGRRRITTAHRRSSVSGRRDVAAPADRPVVANPDRRAVLICISTTVGVILGYLLAIGIFQWNTNPRLDVVGLLLIVIGGLVWLNAITVDAVRRQPSAPTGGLRST